MISGAVCITNSRLRLILRNIIYGFGEYAELVLGEAVIISLDDEVLDAGNSEKDPILRLSMRGI